MKNLKNLKYVKRIHYTEGYKYQIQQNGSVRIPDYLNKHISRPVTSTFYEIQHQKAWYLVYLKGCAYDGPSGPTLDNKEFMRGALYHDIIYQALREFPGAFSDHEAARLAADRWLSEVLVEDSLAAVPPPGEPFFARERLRCWFVRNTARPRAAYVRYALKKYGKINADPSRKKVVKTAP